MAETLETVLAQAIKKSIPSLVRPLATSVLAVGKRTLHKLPDETLGALVLTGIYAWVSTQVEAGENNPMVAALEAKGASHGDAVLAVGTVLTELKAELEGNPPN